MVFTSDQLPRAIRKLLELNNFSVTGPIQIHGAEIDLVARHIADPFASPIYIEATIEYVDNDKYGKDVGKLAMISQLEPDAKRVIISSSGFSLPVQERARATRIDTLTYDALFRRFEKFDPYISTCLEDSPAAIELHELARVYEEPDFDDQLGRCAATEYLREWRNDANARTRWIIVTGEYGTGKTALTKILQLRWLTEYRNDPALPLPIRIELRNFSRQFDARGLLHYFLDHNNLGHISVDFVLSLIRDQRIILILDGYDEMAQYLHARERRACLEALAELSTGGAKGIITSRPNYFTEVEELQVFETLYRSLKRGEYFQVTEAQSLLEREKSIDGLLAQFIDRFERILQDLTPEQTETLVTRVLQHDADGQRIVLGLLRRIFRSIQAGDVVSLSGKPVIVSYLLDVVETLKRDVDTRATDKLTEWQVYKLIVDKLMLRDFERTPDLSPEVRRSFLHKVAVLLSKRDQPYVAEDQLRDLVAQELRQELARLPVDSRASLLEQRFADLRSSATLTRGGVSALGWRFSHNSLREYLATEFLINGLRAEQLPSIEVPITDAMRMFVASMEAPVRDVLLNKLSRAWKESQNEAIRGHYFSLLWDGLVSLRGDSPDGRNQIIKTVTGAPGDFRSTRLARLKLSSESAPTNMQGADFSRAELSVVE
ncbi:MAG: NACHT domain-containing protein, partial [Ignavibacteriae bacterium]|nr:NACHT domain-containing protein [Ignavibacteriota bacterium]